MDGARKQAFVAALNDAASGTPQRVLAHALGISQQTVSNYLGGVFANIEPDAVFAIEQTLAPDEPGGWLSHHLGYVPVGGSSVLAAIEADPQLRPKHRRALAMSYRAYISGES